MSKESEKQKKMIEVMEWAAARLVDGWWVDVLWGGKLRSCEVTSGKIGVTGMMVAKRDTELAARVAIMEMWEAKHGVLAKRRVKLQGLADLIGCSFETLESKDIWAENSNSENMRAMSAWALNEWGAGQERIDNASVIGDLARSFFGGE